MSAPSFVINSVFFVTASFLNNFAMHGRVPAETKIPGNGRKLSPFHAVARDYDNKRVDKRKRFFYGIPGRAIFYNRQKLQSFSNHCNPLIFETLVLEIQIICSNQCFKDIIRTLLSLWLKAAETSNFPFFPENMVCVLSEISMDLTNPPSCSFFT